MSMYIVLTNVVCLLPAKLLWSKGEWGDCLFTGLTGLASLMYHIDAIYPTILLADAIRLVDVIMADLLVFHICNYILAKKRRWDVTIALLPINIYITYIPVEVRFAIMTGYSTMAIGWVLCNMDQYTMSYMILGFLTILGEVIFFMFGNQVHYNWLHGTHHVAAFMAEWLVIKGTELKDII